MPARLEADVFRQVRGLAADGAGAARVDAPAVAPPRRPGDRRDGRRRAGGGRGPFERGRDARRTHEDGGRRAAARDRARGVVSDAKAAAPVVARRAKSRAPVDPPAELASRPDLFVDLPMIRELEKMQHFDSIATTEDSDGGEAPSPNG